MKVLLVNTSEHTGGAAVAAHRLMEALQKHGTEAKMVVRDKQSERLDVISVRPHWLMKLYFLWERLIIWIANCFHKENLFSVDIANAGTDITQLSVFKEADIIHLHWINQGMLSLKSIQKILKSGKPVIWTMHDMWPCTGICHHARTCTEFHNTCIHCPYLYKTKHRHNIEHSIFEKKRILYASYSIYFVGCSQWLQNLAQQSALCKHQFICSIPNPINVNLFAPRNVQTCRELFGLPLDKQLILFASVKTTDKRKGIDFLIEACNLLVRNQANLKEKIAIVLVGNHSEEITSQLPFNAYSLGYIQKEKDMVNVYNAADLFVTPSLEENLPNTIMEAMACGTPCVGFKVGGIPEMIDHQINGYVAKYQSATDLADGLCWCLNKDRYKGLSQQARQKVLLTYSEDIVASQYIELYKQSLLKK